MAKALAKRAAKPPGKPKPSAAIISILGHGNEPPTLAEFATTLCPLLVQDGVVHAAGKLLNTENRIVGTVQLQMSHGHWPQSKPVGRPTADEKHLAVFLAWLLSTSRSRGKRGMAYDDVASRFGYGEGGKVRRVCADIAPKHGLPWPIPEAWDNWLEIANTTSAAGTLDAAMLIARPTWYEDGEGFLLLGQAHLWADHLGARVFSTVVKTVVDRAGPDFDIAKWSRKGGPIIVTSFRPGPNSFRL